MNLSSKTAGAAVSADAARRTLPQALILALLVGGTGAFLVEEAHGLEGDHATEAADVLPEGAVAGADAATQTGQRVDGAADMAATAATAATADGPGTADGAGAGGAVSAPHSVEALVVPHVPGAPSEPQLPSRGRHAKARRHAAEEVRPAELTDQAANRGRHRASAPLVRFGTGHLDWAALARCESGGNPHITDPSGQYGGLYQFDAHTWHSLGGHGLPQNASAAEQTSRAGALFHARGTSPWPVCGHRAEH